MPMTTTTDYSIHRLSHHSDIKKYFNETYSTKSGDITFWQYAERLYRKITMMVPGETLMIDDLVGEDNLEVFIKTICAFIQSGVAQGFYFNKTFTELRRQSAPITQSKENILKQKKI